MMFGSRNSKVTPRKAIWRHELPLASPPLRVGLGEQEVDRYWRELVLIHTSFSATDQEEYGQITAAMRDIEKLFLDRPELQDYYDECHQPPGKPVRALRVTEAYRYRHVAAIQARFMEDVYFDLKLVRFANALDNRGWMNLFRSWGQSDRFNRVFDELQATFTSEFIHFYASYIRNYPGPIEEYPVPHPWDSDEMRRDPRTRAEGAVPEWLPGVFHDSGIQEVIVDGSARGAPAPSPGSSSRGVEEEVSKMMRIDDDVDRGGDMPTGSGAE